MVSEMIKKITASKTIAVKIDGAGRYYFPDDLTLKNKKIVSIIPVLGIYSFVDNAASLPIGSGDNLFMSLTADGVNYFYDGVSVAQVSESKLKGKYEQYNQVLDLPNCYIDCKGNTTGYLHLVVFYEDLSFVNSVVNMDSNYDYAEIPLLYENGLNNPLPDNNTLRGKKFRNIISTFTSYTPMGSAGVKANIAFNYGYITLCSGSRIILDRMPLKLLRQETMYQELQFDNIQFDFENSFVQIFGSGHDIADKFLYLIFKYER